MFLSTSVFMIYDRWTSYPEYPFILKLFYSIFVDFPSGVVWPITWPTWYFTTYYPDSWIGYIFIAIGSFVELIIA